MTGLWGGYRAEIEPWFGFEALLGSVLRIQQPWSTCISFCGLPSRAGLYCELVSEWLNPFWPEMHLAMLPAALARFLLGLQCSLCSLQVLGSGSACTPSPLCHRIVGCVYMEKVNVFGQCCV